MLVFFILWLPIFFGFWKEIRPKPVCSDARAAFLENICAIATGTAYAVVRFVQADFVQAGGFGLSRYLSACVDYAALPVVLPLVVCAAFHRIQKQFFHRGWTPDWTGFILLSLTPVALVCAVRWGSEKNPLLLVLTPLLWTALAVAVHPLLRFIAKGPSTPRLVVGVAGIVPLPFLASAAWWQFFIQRNLVALGLLAVLVVPAVLVVCSLLRQRRNCVPYQS
ncbi:MAG: hypothetical protein LBS82_03725 [Spirochaetaceae bacterium]|jgi:hypothetical protein|nr:hypothetical protein [Spirochaetaceae bacterium]